MALESRLLELLGSAHVEHWLNQGGIDADISNHDQIFAALSYAQDGFDADEYYVKDLKDPEWRKEVIELMTEMTSNNSGCNLPSLDEALKQLKEYS